MRKYCTPSGNFVLGREVIVKLRASFEFNCSSDQVNNNITE
jgi:hypothetical protein